MLYPVQKLLTNQNNVLCISQTETIRNALAKMVQNDYSQLPVVNSAGDLVGIVSEQTLTRTYYHLDENVLLFNLTVDHCMTKPVELSVDADIFDALDLLQRVYAIVITDKRKPVGLLTYYDTTHFFRNLTEGLILVEDLETTLRQYIEDVYTEEEKLTNALINCVGANPDGSPKREFSQLSLGETINMIIHPKNWSHFQPFFDHKPMFQRLMDEVRQIRNQLAHFKGELDPIQFALLRRATDWIAGRPRPKTIRTLRTTLDSAILDAQVVTNQDTLTLATSEEKEGKYGPLARWLRQQPTKDQVQLTFDQIERILQEDLPPTAREHRSWWANDSVGHRQSRAWLETGWRVSNVDMAAGTVVFEYTEKALRQIFFTDVTQRIRQIRPGSARGKVNAEENYYNFGVGGGFSYAWVFPRHDGVRVEVYIDTGDKEKNKQLFGKLYQHKDEIERVIGVPLNWSELIGRRASRISINRPIDLNDLPEEIESAKIWSVEMMLKFLDAFQPRIKELDLE